MDVDKMSWPLSVRQWKTEDRIIPFGMIGSQSVADHLTNRKISSSIKEKALVLCGSDSTIYAIFFPEITTDGQWGTVSDLVKCNQLSSSFLVAEFTTEYEFKSS